MWGAPSRLHGRTGGVLSPECTTRCRGDTAMKGRSIWPAEGPQADPTLPRLAHWWELAWVNLYSVLPFPVGGSSNGLRRMGPCTRCVSVAPIRKRGLAHPRRFGQRPQRRLGGPACVTERSPHGLGAHPYRASLPVDGRPDVAREQPQLTGHEEVGICATGGIG